MLFLVFKSAGNLATLAGSGNMPVPDKHNAPRNIFLLPGINEFIPFTWGAIAFVVTLVVHEFGHAILCKVEGVRVKSMGILLVLFPVGGFAEPDEDQLTAAPMQARTRVMSAGVTTNFILAFVAFGLLFGPVLGAIAPVGDTMVSNVTEGGPAWDAGIESDTVLVQIDDVLIDDIRDVPKYIDQLDPDTSVIIHTIKNGVRSEHMVTTGNDVDDDVYGIHVIGIIEDSPAEDAGIEQNSTLTSIDTTKTDTVGSFLTFMDGTKPGQLVHVTGVTEDGYPIEYDIELATPFGVEEGEDCHGFIGIYYDPSSVGASMIGFKVGTYPATAYYDALRSIPSMMDQKIGWVILLGLPVYGFAGNGFRGFGDDFVPFFESIGWAEPLGIGIFWIANILLWTGWLSLYVGLFNCLPSKPLDGGQVLKDYLHTGLNRITGNPERSASIATAITVISSLAVVGSILFMITGPHIFHGLGF